MVVEAAAILDKLHDWTASAVNTDGGFVGGVHGNAALLSHGCKGQDVGKGVRVVPDATKIGDVADE
jgi:hypothetical protein